eukprot:1177675-Prorocentrum_minimum.AAC.1
MPTATTVVEHGWHFSKSSLRSLTRSHGRSVTLHTINYDGRAAGFPDGPAQPSPPSASASASASARCALARSRSSASWRHLSTPAGAPPARLAAFSCAIWRHLSASLTLPLPLPLPLPPSSR